MIVRLPIYLLEPRRTTMSLSDALLKAEADKGNIYAGKMLKQRTLIRKLMQENEELLKNEIVIRNMETEIRRLKAEVAKLSSISPQVIR
jgi:hypothetical protein